MMINNTHASLLQDIDAIVKLMAPLIPGFETELNSYYRKNRECQTYLPLLNRNNASGNNFQLLDHACRFLFEEFADIVTDERWLQTSEPKHPAIHLKRRHLSKVVLNGLPTLNTIDQSTRRRFADHSGETVDCLILTARPKEFMAVARKLDYYLDGSDPRETKGFPHEVYTDEDNDPRTWGWVRGLIKSGNRTATIIVACQADQGPTHAASCVEKIMSADRFVSPPRHILVTGIAANLTDGNEITLGDLGVSTNIRFYSTAKLQTSPTSVDIDGVVETAKLPDAIRRFCQLDANSKRLNYLGIMDPAEVTVIQAVCSSARDKVNIAKLPKLTRSTLGVPTIKPGDTTCPETILKVAKKVARSAKWKQRITVSPPDAAKPGSPKVKTGEVLSGPFLIKTTGIRNFMKASCPDSILLEMEVGGATVGRDANSIPVLVKAACDWGDEKKNDRWQPYCADVAASFAVELALQLSNKPLTK